MRGKNHETPGSFSSGTVSPAQRVKVARRIAFIALWSAIGVVLAGIDHLIPKPLPWIKLGLANGAALVVLFTYGWKSAFTVNVTRVFITGLLLGTWASPAFILSLSGAVSSVAVMSITMMLLPRYLGPVGISTIGAWTHMLTQFIVVSLIITRHAGIFLVAGPSMIAAIISGILTGILCTLILNKIPVQIR